MTKFRLWAILALLITISSNAFGALIERAGGAALYDTIRDVTILADANLAADNPYGSTVSFGGGLMRGSEAPGFIDDMNAASHLGVNTWRIPVTPVPDETCTSDEAGNELPVGDSIGFNCTGSDLGDFFYVALSGTAGQSILTSGDPSALALFENLLAAPYWSVQAAGGNYWFVNFNNGGQSQGIDGNGGYLLPVANGDVLVPVPAAAWLFGSALALLGWLRCRPA